MLFISASIFAGGSFLDGQMKYPRVRDAEKRAGAVCDSLLNRAGINQNNFRIYIRVFKHEQKLELWSSNCDSCLYRLIKTYSFTAFSGILGPKRAQGDYQTPEGLYFIDRFNPRSNFHLSLGINYPNKSDRIRTKSSDPGGDIFIHGNMVTIGCIPLGDKAIEELYLFAVRARSFGQDRIRVYIYPFRFDNDESERLKSRYSNRPNEPLILWDELGKFYEAFNNSGIPPKFRINGRGEYSPILTDFPSGQK